MQENAGGMLCPVTMQVPNLWVYPAEISFKNSIYFNENGM